MRRLIPVWLGLVAALLLPAIAAAQTITVHGQVFDQNGNPWAGVSVQVQGENGQTFNLKTDKNGKFSQIGVSAGVYTFVLTEASSGLHFTQQEQVSDDNKPIVFNFKEIIAQQAAAHPGDEEKQKQAQNNFKVMKGHVDDGVAKFSQINALQTQIRTAPPDQRSALQAQVKTAATAAAQDFQQAETLVGEKDTKNHAIILANLGQAYDLAGQYDQAVAAYQKAVALNPEAPTYLNMSLAQVSMAAQSTDPAAASKDVSDAGASCDKASALDPTTTTKCWKNIAIVLTNKGDFKDAVAPLQKVTQVDPKDAQAWYLLGTANVGLIDSKQVGNKMTYIIPPGTADAFQKCIALDPNGPYAAQAKQNLDALSQMSGGQSLSEGETSSKKKKKRR
jgi:tetratricopeptide (TPR) repeat protein